MRPELVGAVHGAAELLPISSSAHVLALAPGDHALAVAAHLGSAPVTVLLWRRDWLPPRPGLQLAALLPPVAVGGLLPGIARRSAPAGLVAGSALLAAAALAGGGVRAARDAGVRDGAALGVAQALALWPGVSRLGAAFCAARWRGFAPAEALSLAREVAVPVSVAAAVRTAPAIRRDGGSLRVALASAAGTLAAAPAGRMAARSPWPFIAWRLALAALLRRAGKGV